MTNEEAMDMLKRVEIAKPIKFEDYADMKEALDIAIMALEHMNVIDKIRAEIAEYGSIWVEYKITGRRDKDIERLVSDVLKQAKEEVLEIIDKYIEGSESE